MLKNVTDGRTDKQTDGRTDTERFNIPHLFYERAGDNKVCSLAVINHISKYHYIITGDEDKYLLTLVNEF